MATSILSPLKTCSGLKLPWRHWRRLADHAPERIGFHFSGRLTGLYMALRLIVKWLARISKTPRNERIFDPDAGLSSACASSLPHVKFLATAFELESE